MESSGAARLGLTTASVKRTASTATAPRFPSRNIALGRHG